ncbi:uncharacterized protein LOC116259437 isoform X2 [Nymphaea colorata]|uniref:uncharacterized protein LOC116259437 isoform X2 n=1 Tax=Nymphaea colorata TaxID=210225 RepID=UPI00214DF7D0|nr:uncharacterized protein LOC116259437 isoform X2 [Nymphaea colorata]
MAAPALLHQLPTITNYHLNRRRLGRGSRPPEIPHSIHLTSSLFLQNSRVETIDFEKISEVLREGFRENFTSIEGNRQANGTNFSCNQNLDPVRRDGSNSSSTTGGSEVAFLRSTGITRDDEHSGKPSCKPIKEQDFWQDSLLDTGTTAAVRSRRLLERKSKNERRKWNSNKPSETLTSVNQEKTVWLVNKGKPRLRVKARRLSVIEEAEISSSIKELMRVEEARGSMRKVFGREPTRGEVSRVVGSDISAMRSSLKRGWYSKHTLLSSSMGLIRSIAAEHQGRGIAIEDLVQAGVLSLLRGINKFDHSRGYRLSTYSYWWIRDGITKAVVRYSRLIRLPRHVYTLITRVRKTNKLLSENSGRIPRPDEVAEIVGLSVENLSMVLQASKDPVSLDQPFRRGSYTTHMHLVPDEDTETATEMFMRELLREEMTKLIGSISPREAEVLRYRYGFQNGRTMTLDEIGSIFKVSKQRIGQIESSALDKLKQYGGLHSLRHFLYKDSV